MPRGEVVQLSAGTFKVNNHVRIGKGMTLRGDGREYDNLQKTNREPSKNRFSLSGRLVGLRSKRSTAVNLTADAVQGTRSMTVER